MLLLKRSRLMRYQFDFKDAIEPFEYQSNKIG